MKLFFAGDIMGRAGREALNQYLPEVKKRYSPDIIVINGENAASGRGITMKIAKEFFEWGADVITTGNHAWDQREMLAQINNEKRILRPHNYPKGTAGSGLVVHTSDNSGKKYLIVNLMARLFMDPLDDPFACMEDILKTYQLGRNVDVIFVDFHGETTSEKMSFGHHFDGRITGMIGTHTHVPTADAHVLTNGTAYQTDAGMTGCYDSVIGVEKSIAIHRFIKKTPGEPMRPAKGPAMLCGAVIDINEATGLAKSIQPVRIGAILAETPLPNK